MKFRVLLAPVLGLALATTQAATFTVTITGDSGPGSLRQAILDANATPGDDTIVFTTNGTITLAAPLPLVSDNTSIIGPGTNQLTISGNNAVQVFSFNAGTTNTLSDLTIANGLATGYQNGAGIANAGALTLTNCALVNNTNLGGWGGAVFNSGSMAIINSRFDVNQVSGQTGAGGQGSGYGCCGALMGGGAAEPEWVVGFSPCLAPSASLTAPSPVITPLAGMVELFVLMAVGKEEVLMVVQETAVIRSLVKLEASAAGAAVVKLLAAVVEASAAGMEAAWGAADSPRAEVVVVGWAAAFS